MDAAPSRRDYSLIGRDAKLAVETGLAAAEWYHTDIPRKQMKELMQRSDGPAIRDTIIWLAVLILSGAGGAWFWGTWWCVPFFFVFGVLYGSSTDSRWHECGHGTAFRTQWMND
ncbi:MAG: fatty acid desaturase, partial [Mesorhizobium sp.]